MDRNHSLVTHFLLFTETYIQRKHTYCLQYEYPIYGVFNDLDVAKVSCDADPTCGKVNDYECDGANFSLCKKGIKLEQSSLGSCVYDKGKIKLNFAKKIEIIHFFK